MKLDDIEKAVHGTVSLPWQTDDYGELHARWPASKAAEVMVNHSIAFLDLARAVQQRIEARCWSVSESEAERRKTCWCGDRDATDACPITKADLAIYACYRELEAVE